MSWDVHQCRESNIVLDDLVIDVLMRFRLHVERQPHVPHRKIGVRAYIHNLAMVKTRTR